MPTFTVKWSVTEIVNGPGKHDDGVRDGDRYTLAEGVSIGMPSRKRQSALN